MAGFTGGKGAEPRRLTADTADFLSGPCLFYWRWATGRAHQPRIDAGGGVSTRYHGKQGHQTLRSHTYFGGKGSEKIPHTFLQDCWCWPMEMS